MKTQEGGGEREPSGDTNLACSFDHGLLSLRDFEKYLCCFQATRQTALLSQQCAWTKTEEATHDEVG